MGLYLTPRRPVRGRGLPRRAWWVAVLIALLVAGVALWRTYPLVLAGMARYLVVDDGPAPSDAIIVLGGDWKGRIQKGIELYREGYAPLLVVTGGLLVAPDRTQADYLAEVAERSGVPAQAIVKEPRSDSTYQDAALTLELAREHGWRRVLVVTSDWHSRRAATIFRKLYGPAGIEVRSVPSPEWRFETSRWWEYPDGGETIVIEWVRLVWYALRF
ncbi:YdcF family protein [Carboxydochorda subterranea]|uniref:YdcF family protein n=1 Tax=Carboxydichorda subterranea TaxID=3109565 RepID=A0ABZ1BWS9_9FIRM|nr:YdcF family protein [Limnochorda sp. L945t]WRP17260.1 YdcF family protein [Limnochorda sp. L945t]